MRVVLALLFVITWAAQARAHAAGANGGMVTSASSWDAAALVMVAMGGLLYAIGSWRLSHRGARVRAIERVAFWTGWTVLVAAVAPPIDAASAIRFSVHMAQHEMLMLIGAPLMIAGRPIVPWLWALPARLRPSAGGALQSRAMTFAWRSLTTPAIAWALHGLAIWVWHLPVLYEAAVRNEALHAFQHATFIGTAAVFWWGLVYGRYGRAAYGASVLYIFTTMLHTGILGALFALSTSPFYSLYRDRAAAAGFDATVDQQLAGLLMWVPAGMVLTVCGLGLLLAWMAESERRARVSGHAGPPSPRGGYGDPGLSPAVGQKMGRKRAGLGLVLLAISGLSSGACGTIPHEQAARRLTGGDPYRGRARIAQYGCDSCHTIPGIPTADATVGPPLTQVARRMYLAGHIENTPENMRRWIEHPHAFDDRTAMPEMGVSTEDSRDIVAYLYTLR